VKTCVQIRFEAVISTKVLHTQNQLLDTDTACPLTPVWFTYPPDKNKPPLTHVISTEGPEGRSGETPVFRSKHQEAPLVPILNHAYEYQNSGSINLLPRSGVKAPLASRSRRSESVSASHRSQHGESSDEARTCEGMLRVVLRFRRQANPRGCRS